MALIRCARIGRSAKLLARYGWRKYHSHADTNNRNGADWINFGVNKEQFAQIMSRESLDKLRSAGFIGTAFWITDLQWKHDTSITDKQWDERITIG